MWLTDPKTGQRSVSLTMLVLATALMAIFIVLEAFGTVKSTQLLDEFFFTTYGLYFGRRVQGFRGAIDPPQNSST